MPASTTAAMNNQSHGGYLNFTCSSLERYAMPVGDQHGR